MQAPGAVEEVARLQNTGTQLEPLLALLLPAVVRAVGGDGDASEPASAAAALLRDLVGGLDLRSHARPMTEQLLGVIARDGDPVAPDVLMQLQQALRCTNVGRMPRTIVCAELRASASASTSRPFV